MSAPELCRRSNYSATSSGVALELVEEFARRRDWQCGRERENMFISRDELGALARGESQ
jgi:hypothetical protein